MLRVFVYGVLLVMCWPVLLQDWLAKQRAHKEAKCRS